MKILEVKTLALPEVKVIKFARYPDERGYFTEAFRREDFKNHPELAFVKSFDFIQQNESYSKAGVIRGLHFQWQPFIGKLIRTTLGHMVDLAMDIRKGSSNFGKIIAYDMPADPANAFGEWIWLPPGFAHGNFFLQDSAIEYLCTGEYHPATEAGVSPLAGDLDWSLCDRHLKSAFEGVKQNQPTLNLKDRSLQNLSGWSQDPLSGNFIFKK